MTLCGLGVQNMVKSDGNRIRYYLYQYTLPYKCGDDVIIVSTHKNYTAYDRLLLAIQSEIPFINPKLYHLVNSMSKSNVDFYLKLWKEKEEIE